MDNYTQLDKEIMKSVTNFPGGNFQNIYAGRVAKEAHKIDPMKADKITYNRMIELQKQGVIYQKNKQWFPVLPE